MIQWLGDIPNRIISHSSVGPPDSFAPPERLEKTAGRNGVYDYTIDPGWFTIDRAGRRNHGIITGAKFAKVQSD